MSSSEGEEVRLLEALGAELWFEGPSANCPACDGTLDQLALILDLEGARPLSCGGCGAVLAA